MPQILQKYRDEIKEQIKAARRKSKNKKLPSVSSYLILDLERKLRKNFPKASIAVPPEHVEADIAISGVPKDKLDLLKSKLLKMKEVETASVAGVFLNATLKRGDVYKDTLLLSQKLGDAYGMLNSNDGRSAVVEYSSPNITKPIGVGHLRSTIIGQTLANIYEATGYHVIRENYLGDWGTQFGKVIYGYYQWADKAAIEVNPIQTLKDVYVKFQKEAQFNPKLEDEARAIFRRLEEGDEELIRIWKRFRDLSIKDYKKIYDTLDIHFDVYTGEAFFVDQTDVVLKQCEKTKLCRKDPESEALIVDTLENTPSFLLRKSDGTTLYLTRELALMKFRAKTYKPDVVLVATGQEQTLHFKQLVGAAEHLGYLKNIEFHHAGFGMLLVDGKKMSTREGTVVELYDLIHQSIEKSKSIIKEKNSDLSDDEVHAAADVIGVGAIIYNDLRQSYQKNISFDWKRMLDFEQGSAAYLQYTYARIRSILRKFGDEVSKKVKPVFEEAGEFAIAKKLLFFPQVIQKAQKLNAPHMIATYCEELAQLVNSFYNVVSIKGTKDENLRESRLLLIQSAAQTIKNGLKLLNINVPERM